MDEDFGRYRLVGLIGKGGMGQVYRAHDTAIGRDVAIKVLPTELVGEPGYRERFRREAYTVARLNEPHIIPIYDTGEIDGRLYLVMPIVEGVDLQTLLARDGTMSPQLAVKVIEQVAAALDAAHAAGLVHRDIKPSNVLMTSSEFAYLIDFGIAHDTKETRLTQTGSVIGTLAYMAPERFTAGIADARADVYALACVLHECLTGESPYPGKSLEQVMAGHLTVDPPRPTVVKPGVPLAFDSVIAGGMAKDPERRYQSASQLAIAARSALVTNTSATAAAAAAVPATAATSVAGHPGPQTAVTAPPNSAPPSYPPPGYPPRAPRPPVDPPAVVAPTRRVSATHQPVAPPPHQTVAPVAPVAEPSSSSSSIPFVIAAVLALAAIAVALIGLGAPPVGGELPPGSVTINGVDPTVAGDVSVDLSKPLSIAVATQGADSVSLGLNVLGVPVGSREAPLAPGPAGVGATLPSPVNRFVLAGRVPAEIMVLRGGTPVGTYRFVLSSTQPATVTVTSLATLVLLLLATAYVESNLRVLRRGRESPASLVAVPLFSAAFAVGVVIAAWVLLGTPPTVATLAVSAGLAAVAGLAAAIGSSRAGRRARARRSGRR